MRFRWPSWARRKASPWRRKMSATSRLTGMIAAGQGGGTTSIVSRSSGLSVCRIRPLETWV
jgi:hypothetical protein